MPHIERQALFTFQNKLWLKWPPRLFLQQEQGGKLIGAWLGACQLMQPEFSLNMAPFSMLPEGQDELKGMRQQGPNSIIFTVFSRKGT